MFLYQYLESLFGRAEHNETVSALLEMGVRLIEVLSQNDYRVGFRLFYSYTLEPTLEVKFVS